MKTLNVIKSVLLISLLLGLASCKPKHDKKHQELSESHVITKAQAQSFFDHYSSNNYAKINAEREKPDSRSFYYTVEELESYVDYIKKLNKEKGDSLGIRVYFGSYPEGFVHEDVITGNQNVFFGPSYKENDPLESPENVVIARSLTSAENEVENESEQNSAQTNQSEGIDGDTKYFNIGYRRPR